MEGNDGKDSHDYNVHVIAQHKRVIASVTSNEYNLHSE